MFNPDINIALQLFSTFWLDQVMLLFTSLGNEAFYMMAIPVVYWCVNRRWGHQVGFVFLGSMWLNGYLKDLFAMPRPTAEQGVRLVVHEASNGFPSGHAQGAVTLWGYLLLKVCSVWFRCLCIFLIVMIAISRLYLGAHYLVDVLGGLVIGAAVLALFMIGFVREWGRTWSKWLKVILSIAIPLLLMTLTESEHTYMILGALMGLLVTDVFALDGLAYEERAPWLKQAAKLAVGFTGFALLYLIIRQWMPQGLPELIGFAFIGVWITVGAPLLFKKIGLAPPDKSPHS